MWQKNWLRLVGVLLLGALVASACGSDRDDDDAAPPPAEEEVTETPAETAAFGDLESPCGEGEGGPAGDQGVTEDSITIGYGDDAGFSGSPGLSAELSDAVEALIDWCNEQGGINGRTIEGKYYDAKITEVNNAMQQACTEVFMLVGQGWALDASQEETRIGCELPSVPAYSVSPAFANGPWMIQGVPNPVDYTPGHVADAIAERFPEESKKVATLAANLAAHIDTRAKAKSGYAQFGWEFLDCDVEYNVLGEADWKPFAQRLKDCGAEIVYFVGTPFPSFTNFLEAAAQLEFDPVYVVDANLYQAEFAEWNTNGLADDVYLRFAFVPFEERDESEAVDTYMSLVEEQDGKIALLGVQATSSFLLWATGVKNCGAEVTRQCVLDEIAEIEDWTAGGLHAPTQPAENLPPACGLLLKLEGPAFVRVEPEEAASWDCDDAYLTPVTGTVVDDARLDENRVSTLYTGG